MAWSFIKGAKAANHLVNIITIRDLRINGCLGCEYCYDHKGECIQNDDMQNVYNVLSETDIIVFATPIYYQSFPSQLKAVIDRLYVTENKSFPIEGSALLATYATPDKKMEEQTVIYYKTLIAYHEWRDLGVIAVSGLDEKEDIIGNQCLNEAYNLGYRIEYEFEKRYE